MHKPPLYEHVLVALFASSSWLGVNAVWMSTSLLVDVLPERWALPSYLAALVQVACVAPIVYALLKWRLKSVREMNLVSLSDRAHLSAFVFAKVVENECKKEPKVLK